MYCAIAESALFLLKQGEHMRLSVLFLALSLIAHADPKEFYFNRILDNATPVVGTDSLVEGTFDQRIDHDNCCNFATFKQRYYLDSSLAASETAPVFFYICGESTCESRSILGGAIREHAKKFGAHLVALEHRYYGKSQPFPTLTTENLKYLSTQYAVKDLAAFVEFAKEELKLKGKWIAFGGSYPGSLSAYFRSKVPSLVVGALASSAPVMAKADYLEYDKHVAQVAGPTCAAKIRSVVAEIESHFGKPEMLEMKKLFKAEGIKDDTDFLYVIADVGAFAVQYGYQEKFCKALESEDSIKAYGEYAQSVYKLIGVSAEKMSMYEGSLSEDPNSYLEGFGYRPWLYQSCKEYGYWQIAYPDAAVSVRSQRINQEYHNTLCKRLFNIDKPVDTTVINKLFFEPLFDSQNSSNIFFTNGSNDPWSVLSILSEKVEATEQPKNPNLTLMTIKNQAHCDDLRTPKTSDSEILKEARTKLQGLIELWLK